LQISLKIEKNSLGLYSSHIDLFIAAISNKETSQHINGAILSMNKEKCGINSYTNILSILLSRQINTPMKGIISISTVFGSKLIQEWGQSTRTKLPVSFQLKEIQLIILSSIQMLQFISWMVLLVKVIILPVHVKNLFSSILTLNRSAFWFCICCRCQTKLWPSLCSKKWGRSQFNLWTLYLINKRKNRLHEYH